RMRAISTYDVVVEENCSYKDVQELVKAINAVVNVNCTIHGQGLAELKKRPSLQLLFEQNVFQRLIVLEKHANPGHIQSIFDQKEVNILKKPRCLPDEMDRSTSAYRNNYVDRV